MLSIIIATAAVLSAYDLYVGQQTSTLLLMNWAAIVSCILWFTLGGQNDC